MSRAKSRSFYPSGDRLESLCLLSGGMHAPEIVHAQAVVDLKPTTVGDDALRALSNSAPHTGRQRLVVNKLTADDATNKITGLATGFYKVSVIGSINATIKFKTSIDAPKTKDVQVSLNRFNSFLRSSDKLKIQKAVVKFIQQDHDAIVAALHPTS